MELVLMEEELSVFQVADMNELDWSVRPMFIGMTEDEISVVAPVVPEETIQREDNWRGFKIAGVLDFSLVGILAKIATLLAEEGISIFAISTYNTDYILVKADQVDKAAEILAAQEYRIKKSGEAPL
ncbi:amino acid-binding protein [Enterococcus florum]|uniref:Amino acid-binding protein n=1 Tax=Enterococcus florum TaxID=2480627 RepID=A0A4P5PBJ9_9ENTE|nr:ACT domain-containing protein [Enterococcus florum]GCF95410.1 amino acid-binding protein [Enterococcus florum]